METRSKSRGGLFVVVMAVLIALVAGVLTVMGEPAERVLTLAAAWGDGKDPGVAKIQWTIAHERWQVIGQKGHWEKIIRARVGDTVILTVDPRDGTLPSCSIRGGANTADGTGMCSIGIVT